MNTLMTSTTYSQVVYSASIVPDAPTATKITQNQLTRFLSSANNWMTPNILPSSHVPPPVLNMVCLWPVGSDSIQVLNEKGLPAPSNSFSIPGWGSVVILPPTGNSTDSYKQIKNEKTKQNDGYEISVTDEDEVYELSEDMMEEVAAKWAAQMRAWLGLNPFSVLPEEKWDMEVSAEPDVFGSINGFSNWELCSIGRYLVWRFLVRASESLVGLVNLANSLPDLNIPQEIGLAVDVCVDRLQTILALEGRADVASLVYEAREGHQLALEALHNSSMMGDTYFSLEFKAAVYLPIVIPFCLPILAELRKRIREYFKKRKEKKADSLKKNE